MSSPGIQYSHKTLCHLLPKSSLMGNGGTSSDTESMSEGQITSILEAYFDGLRANDVSDVPFTENVVWENPLTRLQGEPVRGRDNVIEALETAATNMPQINIERHIIDGNNACSIFEWMNKRDGFTVPTADYFEIEDGSIKRDLTYFDLSNFNLSDHLDE